MGELNEDHFQEMIQNYPEIHRNLINEARLYKDHLKLFQIEQLGKVDYLKNMPFNVKEDIHYKLTLENYEKNAKVFLKGADCEHIYFVVHGELELLVDEINSTNEHLLDLLPAGSILG